jgi:hypothetical protein
MGSGIAPENPFVSRRAIRTLAFLRSLRPLDFFIGPIGDSCYASPSTTPVATSCDRPASLTVFANSRSTDIRHQPVERGEI